MLHPTSYLEPGALPRRSPRGIDRGCKLPHARADSRWTARSKPQQQRVRPFATAIVLSGEGHDFDAARCSFRENAFRIDILEIGHCVYAGRSLYANDHYVVAPL